MANNSIEQALLTLASTCRLILRTKSNSISGLVAEYIVAIDVTRVRFPADALCWTPVIKKYVACLLCMSINPLR